ncbi:hypothetical protein [uncultured Desulfobacter sp.]|uniref:hypothetical protein n=1 Tax=uncultured Desulfobacter sp. TaxID=240139 RepID=UPI002AABDCB3|nr:hypothetical protein [uncultured Desulfobacter sp.]
MAFENETISKASLADKNNPDLTDSDHNGLFLKYLSGVYLKFFDVLDLEVLNPIPPIECRLKLTGYPQGLPSWEVKGGIEALSSGRFWHKYDLVLKGFLDFYRTFFTLVSSGSTKVQKDAAFPDRIEDILLFSDQFHQAARMIRLQVIHDPMFANEIRWQPAYKQLLYRDDVGRLIVTISQNSVGNAITELLWLVVRRIPDAQAYSQAEPALVRQLLEVRDRLVDYNLGDPIATPSWPRGVFVPQ